MTATALTREQRTTMTERTTELLAERVVGTQFEDLPAEVVRAAEHVVLDGVSNMLAGSREPMSETVLSAMQAVHGVGGHTIVGHEVRLSMLSAAFVNAVFCHSMDYEMMWYPLTHPTSPVLPALFALAEHQPIDGSDLLLALAQAFEVQGRLRKAIVDGGIPQLWGLHPPGVVGVIGSAAGAARLLSLDAHQAAMAMSMACSRAAGVMVNTGTHTKASHSGNAARLGIECALLVANGMTASTQGLEGHHGLNDTLYEGKMDLAGLVRDFGTPYRMVDPGLGVKGFPSQYPTHWSNEAAVRVRAANHIQPSEIEAVEVIVGANNESAVRTWPKTGLEGKFCIAYTVACALLDGSVKIASFRDERLARPDMEAIRPRITVVLDPAIDAMDFLVAESTVRVKTPRGTFEQRVTRPKGIWDNPLNDDERNAKFNDCALAGGVPMQRSALIATDIARFRELPDVGAFVKELAPPW
jgi:2-methylcitrate dehydratase PrpD